MSARELCNTISVLINYSVNEGCVPSTWKHAVITPASKVKPFTKIADLRPVTPVFSRIRERLVMRKHLLPVIPNESLRNQFAYKLSGSTSALVSLTDTVGRLLEVNKYMRCIMIDFSKAFDTVNHEILLSKLQKISNSS